MRCSLEGEIGAGRAPDLSTSESLRALAACWSGAGPTLIGFVTRDRLEQVRTDAASALAAAGVPGRVVALAADRRGLVYGDEAIVDL